MAGTEGIKDHITSVRETKKITSAMYLIASTKLRRARGELNATRPYFDALRSEIVRIFRTDEHIESRYFVGEDGALPKGGVCGLLVITADKGLAGAYNVNVLRRAEEELRAHPGARLFVVGEYGRRYFEQHRIPTEKTFLYTAQNPTMERAREICTQLLDLYDGEELDELIVVYTDLKNSLSSTALTSRLLPFERAPFERAAAAGGQKTYRSDFEYYPSVAAVLEGSLRSYLVGFIYSALVDSFCSEQNARVTAMDAANRNADELLASLTLQLNRERQAAITQEITEVSAGAKALARSHKHGKEASGT